jgi:cell division septum initiation protein DivIVA
VVLEIGLLIYLIVLKHLGFSALFNAISTPLNVLVSTIQTVVEAFSFLIDGEFSKAGEAFVGGFKRTAKIVVDEAKNVVNTFVENSEEASKAIIKIQTAEEKAVIESKKRQAAQNQQLAQQRALDVAKEAAEVKKAEDKAKKQKERAVKTAKRDADRKAKVEAREKEKALSFSCYY